MRVIKVNKKRGNIVLSRKVLLEEENAEKKKITLDTLSEGKVLRGTVKNLTDYGAFIDLGGIDGLLHITDMSWGRVTHPSEVVQGRRRDRRHRPQVRSGHRARLARPQADRRRSVERRHRALSGGHARVRQGRQPDRLRRVHRARAGRRGAHPRLRDVVEQAGQAPVEDPQLRATRSRRWCSASTRAHAASPSASSRSRRNPWHELADKYPVGTHDHRQGPQPDRVRRVRRGGGGHRRPHPHLRHVVEQGEAPVGGAEEGRRRSRRRCSASTPRTSGCRSA